jgi:hypothetical protein
MIAPFGRHEQRYIARHVHSRQSNQQDDCAKALNRAALPAMPHRKNHTKSGSPADSPVEEGVSSEPVSEWGSSAAGNNGTIPRRLWMITEAEKGHFGLEYAGNWVFALRQLLLLPSS